MSNEKKVIIIHPSDIVAVAITDLKEGEIIKTENQEITLKDNIPMGHKLAIKSIKKDENIIKYGNVIGRATEKIDQGENVHTHNMVTNLEGLEEYEYEPENVTRDLNSSMSNNKNTFWGYYRDNGDVAVRNDIWIINTTGCVNNTANILVELAKKEYGNKVDSIYSAQHNYGCSQLGQDHLNTQKILANLVNHPNAAGVLIISLGCENNNITEFKKVLGDYDSNRVKIMVTQEESDEIEKGMELLGELIEYAQKFERVPVPISELIVGFKCGASDAFSGITGNPLVGSFSDKLIKNGGTTILTEVPEMFGAETILMNRAYDEAIFNKTVSLINDFKEYYMRHGEKISENPAPGNLEGGITTLEEKSLGCIQKGGTSKVVDVLRYGETIKEKGLNLLEAPGNDLVSITALTASKAHMILFTTGRGNPLGSPVPTVKISTNSKIYKKKPNWIDFNAGELLEDKNMDELTDELFEYVIKVASGELLTNNEKYGYKNIGIFKDGVIL